MNFLCKVLSAITLALCLDFIKLIPVNGDGNNTKSDSEMKDLLITQRNQTHDQLSDTMHNKCSKNESVNDEEIIGVFFKSEAYTPTTTCFVDCVLRELGLLNDKGFQVDPYITLIRKSVYNYTADATGDESYTNAVKSFKMHEKTVEVYDSAANKCVKGMKLEAGTDNKSKAIEAIGLTLLSSYVKDFALLAKQL